MLVDSRPFKHQMASGSTDNGSIQDAHPVCAQKRYGTPIFSTYSVQSLNKKIYSRLFFLVHLFGASFCCNCIRLVD